MLRLNRLMKVIGQGFELKEGKFGLDLRKTIFYGEGSETLERVVQTGDGCPSLEIFKGKSEEALSNPVC